MPLDTLTDTLLSIPAWEPDGMRLLREQREATGQLWPKAQPTPQIIRATMQLKDLAQHTQQIVKQLEKLRPIPSAVPVMEYAL